MKPLGIGIVGAGSIGIRGALEHLILPDVQGQAKAVAICDPVEGRAKAAAEKYGATGAYLTLEELLRDPAVDAVTLCSPIGLHYEQGVACIEAGKHIHFNKTMTVTADEALDLIARAKAKGVKLVASPGQMVRPVNKTIRRMIQEGELGELAWAVAGAAFGTYHEKEDLRSGNDVLTNINPSWYWRKPGGGPLYDMTVYALHTLTGILGPAKRVTAMSGVRIPQREWRGEMYPVDADDNTGILIDFGGGVFAFAHGTVAGMVSEFGQPSFFGTKGSIVGTKLNGEPIQPDEDGPFYGPHAVGKHAEIGEGHVFEDLMQLVEWVREGKPAVATAEHAAHVIEIIEAAYRAAETGVTQELKTSF
ncbi:Gfo/Idh/MocA family oxidoreductase [bacterium]|nr:MAG: Gfo/Idh/MocA family oxidoreductase [bacterium]